MGLPVITVASGGLPVVESTVGGTPVSEAANLRGLPVTKVTGGKPGLPVVYETIGMGVAYPTWDPATISNVTLSNGNLSATNTSTLDATGARVINASGKTSGKYYFELIVTTRVGSGADTGLGIATTAATYTGLGAACTLGVAVFISGTVWSNGAPTSYNFGSLASTWIIGIACDLDNRKAWFRVPASASGLLWNANGTADPVANINGVVIPAGTITPVVFFGGAGIGSVYTANFGAAALAGTVPSGYTRGWPA